MQTEQIEKLMKSQVFTRVLISLIELNKSIYYIKDIYKKVKTTNSHLNKVIRELIECGLIEREYNLKKKKKFKPIKLTENGRKVATRLFEIEEIMRDG